MLVAGIQSVDYVLSNGDDYSGKACDNFLQTLEVRSFGYSAI